MPELKSEEQKNFLQRVQEYPGRLKAYVGELRSEMKKVSWPNRKQVESTTVVVIFTVFAFAAFFFVVDKVLASAITSVQRTFTR
jgi:preprotein translocase subunit SecE